MRVAKLATIFLLIVFLVFGFETAEAIEYFGGKIAKRQRLRHPPAGVPGVQLQVLSQKIVAGKVVEKKETIYISGGVAGVCRPGRSLLGYGKIVKGRKVMQFGICR